MSSATAQLAGSVIYQGIGDADVAVALETTSGSVVATTTTDSDGSFSFSGLAAGSYEVLYDAPTGQALQSGGPADLISGLTGSVAVAAGQSVTVATETMVASTNDVGVYLNWPGASVYDAELASYVSTVGAAPSYVTIGIDYTQPMSDWIGNAQASSSELHRTTDGATITPVLTLPLISKISNGLSELQNLDNIVAGDDDSVWLGIIKAYESAGYTNIDLRIGWEQNGTWYPWSVETTAEAQAYIAAFQHIATLAHNVSGITVSVVWNPSEVDYSPVPTVDSYPGNNYVDVIGLDLYDTVYPESLYDWTTGKVDSSLAQWEANPANLAHYWNYPEANQYYPTGTASGFGLVDAMAFAKANGKEFALPETGAGDLTNSSTDDPTFPAYLASALLAAGAPTIAFADIWNYGTDNFTDGSKPAEAAAWAQFVSAMDAGITTPSFGTITGSVVFGGAGQAGVAVALIGGANGTATLATTTTNAAGVYAFTDLAAGYYALQFTPPAGEAIAGGAPANATTGETVAFGVTAGSTRTVGPVGLVPLPPATVTITGSVLFAGAGQSGVGVALLNSGATTATATTDANGSFSFTGIAAGTYALDYSAPAGEVFQTGGNADTTTGVTGTFTVAAGQSFTAPAENLLLAPVTLLLTSSHATVNPGSGVFIVTGSPGADTLVLSDGDQTVALGGYNNGVTLGDGDETVTFTGSGETLQAGNGTETVTLKGNFDSINFGTTPVGTTTTIAVAGLGEAITGGDGNVAVTGAGGSAVITLGNGNDTVSITGSKNTITVGNGTNVINAGTNGAVVHTGSGGATVTVGGQSNLVDVGAGTNLINTGSGSRLDMFVLNGSGQGLTTITGFNLHTGDVLNLTRALSGVNIAPDLSNLGQYVTASTSNGSTTLSVDPTGGAGTPYDFVALQSVTTSVGALLTAHDIKVG